MQPRDLSAHVAYEAGGGVEEAARDLGVEPDDLVALSSNENPLGPSPEAAAAIREAAGRANSYPKAAHADLVARLAERWGLASEQVWLANGGDGALDYLARAVVEPGDRVLVPSPGFSYYGMSARFHHGAVAEYAVPKAEDFPLTAESVLSAYDGERVVYLNTPHNPSGGEIPPGDVAAVAEGTDAETLVVVDEAYGEFGDRESAAALLDDRDDVAVIRTFSKAYGLAGVRLGYALVPREWAGAYARVNTPFAASEVACRAGIAALSDDEHVERTVAAARWGREHLHEHVAARTWESAANFVLVEVGDATGVADALRTEHHVLVRDCTSFGLPDCIRVTCGTREQTRAVAAAIDEVVEA